MNAFQTELVIPNQVESSSGVFKVVLPVLLLVLIVAFTRSYYPQNGYPVPPLLDILLILALVVLPLVWLYNWYNNYYQKVGKLALSEDQIAYEWEGVKTVKFDVDKVKDLAIVYDGYASATGASSGNQNLLSFVHEGESYNLNFRLNSQEEAEEMGDVIKQWYTKGVRLKETDSQGDPRYLMLYEPIKG